MLALIKFIYTFFLPPGLFVLVFLAAGLAVRRLSRRMGAGLLAAGLLFYASSTPYVGGLLLHTLENKVPGRRWMSVAAMSSWSSATVLLLTGGR